MSDEVQGVTLRGDRNNPEPAYFRVRFPGGDVDVTRCTDGSYWVHVAVNRPGCGYNPEAPSGKIIDGRVDVAGMHASESSAGDLSNPGAYHVAVRVAVE